MLKATQYRRLLWLSLLVVLAYCGLGWRLVDLQYISAGQVRRAYEQRTAQESIELPVRGEIVDRHGAMLTKSVRLYDVAAEPPRLSPFQDRVAAALAGPLQMNPRVLEAMLTPVTNVTAEGKLTVTPAYVPLKKGLTLEAWKTISEIMRTNTFGLDPRQMVSREERTIYKTVMPGLRKFGVRLEAERQSRDYPYDSLAGQILGYVGVRTNSFSVGKTISETVGLAGIERALNKELAGAPGFRRVVQAELTDIEEKYLPAVDGANVVLTIDRRLQEVLDEALAAAREELSATAVFGVMMDVDSGEVLAMSSAPLFNPGDRSHFDADSARQRSVLDEFEPGSIFKIVAVTGALEDGVVDLMTPIDCMNGVMPVRGMASLTDVHPYDVLPVKGVVTKSSNIGTAQIVRMHGHDRFYYWISKFGVGSRTGIGIGEAGGRLPGRKLLRPGDFTRLPIGYGVAVTQMQLAGMYSAVANGGRLMQPRLVLRLTNRDGKIAREYPPELVRRVMTPETSRKMIEALQTVTQPGGTATEAALDHYLVAGKTGTAHKWNDKLKSYDNERYYASFVGFFPASAPRICLAITVDEPDKRGGRGHYGGKAAGPIFRKVATEVAHLLNLKPDRPAPANVPNQLPGDQAALDQPAIGPLQLPPSPGVVPSRPAAPTGLRLSLNAEN